MTTPLELQAGAAVYAFGSCWKHSRIVRVRMGNRRARYREALVDTGSGCLWRRLLELIPVTLGSVAPQTGRFRRDAIRFAAKWWLERATA